MTYQNSFTNGVAWAVGRLIRMGLINEAKVITAEYWQMETARQAAMEALRASKDEIVGDLSGMGYSDPPAD